MKKIILLCCIALFSLSVSGQRSNKAKSKQPPLKIERKTTPAKEETKESEKTHVLAPMPMIVATVVSTPQKVYKLKITLMGIQCIASSDGDKKDDYGIQQHIYYKANGKFKKPESRNINKFEADCDGQLDEGYMETQMEDHLMSNIQAPRLSSDASEGANALLCGSFYKQIHVDQGRARSSNINNSMTFHISQAEYDDSAAEMMIHTTVVEFNAPGVLGGNNNRTYNYDGKKKYVAIKDVLDILTGKREIYPTKPFMDSGVLKGTKLDHFDGTKMPLYQVDYKPKIILEGPLRARGATSGNKAALWMRFELVE